MTPSRRLLDLLGRLSEKLGGKSPTTITTSSMFIPTRSVDLRQVCTESYKVRVLVLRIQVICMCILYISVCMQSKVMGHVIWYVQMLVYIYIYVCSFNACTVKWLFRKCQNTIENSPDTCLTTVFSKAITCIFFSMLVDQKNFSSQSWSRNVLEDMVATNHNLIQ